MTKVVVIASGQSLTDDDVEKCRIAKCNHLIDAVIAISNVALDKAPWADAMISADSNWFVAHPEYMNFKGMIFSKNGYRQTSSYKPHVMCDGFSSGLLGVFLARDFFKAKRICLLGFDMHGTHYFGPHTRKGFKPLTNTTDSRFLQLIKQFDLFTGADVYNATKDSALKKYPFIELEDFISGNET